MKGAGNAFAGHFQFVGSGVQEFGVCAWGIADVAIADVLSDSITPTPAGQPAHKFAIAEN